MKPLRRGIYEPVLELLHSPLIRFISWTGLSYALFHYVSEISEDRSTILAVLVGTLAAVQKIAAELDGLKEQVRKVEEGVSQRVGERWPQ